MMAMINAVDMVPSLRRGRSLGFPPHAAGTRPHPTFDLQSHSVHSDGALAAADVVAHAAAAGLELMALTDHDTVDGVAEALRAAREHGLRCSPGAELSSVSGEFEDLHVCGYELRHDDPELRATLADFRADRGRRIWAMADRLEELGFRLDRSELQAREAAGSRSGARTSPTPCSPTPPTRRSCARRGSTARTRCSRRTSSRARSRTSPARARPSRRRSR